MTTQIRPTVSFKRSVEVQAYLRLVISNHSDYTILRFLGLSYFAMVVPVTFIARKSLMAQGMRCFFLSKRGALHMDVHVTSYGKVG